MTAESNEMTWELTRREDRDRWWLREELYTLRPRTPLSTALVNELAWDESSLSIAEYLSFPDTRGFSVRSVNGYTYLSPVPITDPAEIAQREGRFHEVLGRIQAQVDDDLARIHADQEREQERWRAKNLSAARTIDLIDDWREAIVALKQFWRWHFLIVFPRHAVQGFLEATVAQQAGTPASEIGKLVQSMGWTHQLMLDRDLWQLAARAIEFDLQDLFLDTVDEELADAIERAPRGSRWLAELREFLNRYGSRSPNTLELFEPLWEEDPTPVLATVRSYVAEGGRFDFDRLLSDKAAERDHFTHKVLDAITDSQARSPVEHMLRPARALQAAMEDDNFYFLWGNAQMRRVALECGRRLAAGGALDATDHVFFLEPAEVERALVDIVVGQYDLDVYRRSATERRARWEEQLRVQPPPYLGDPPEVIDDFMMNHFWGIKTRSQLETADSGDITGLGASAGIVEGVARLVLIPSDFGRINPGEILVSPSTNPAWTPLFSKIAAVVTDQGGTLAHAAVVAREYGLPAVVGTIRGTRRIPDGARIRVDGAKGTVTLL